MLPIHLKLYKNLNLLLIPDTLAHLDGHPVITRTYSIFRDTGNPSLARSKEYILHLEEINDPDYFGYISFEVPDRLFSYTPGNHHALDGAEIERIIEYLSDLRNDSSKWPSADKQ